MQQSNKAERNNANMANPDANLSDIFKKSMEANYVTSEEKQALVSEQTHFAVSRIVAKIGGTYGAEWEITVTLNSEERPLSLAAGSRARDTWLENLAEYVQRNGPQTMRMVERKSKNGRDYFSIVPADMSDADLPA